MTATPHDRVFAPTSVHRAIDQVTALKVQVQQMRRQLQSGEPVEPEKLLQLESVLDELAVVLIECRDQHSET